MSWETRKSLHYLSVVWGVALACHAPAMQVAYIVGGTLAVYGLDYVWGLFARTHRIATSEFARLEDGVELTFRNPPGRKAWQLIDAAGGRGLQIGGAQMSEKHCNFMINTGTASAADLETLGETVRERVRAATGVTLQWEIKRIGETPASPGAEVQR